MKKVNHELINIKMCENDWKILCNRYHYEDTDFPLLMEIYNKCFMDTAVSAYYVQGYNETEDTAVLMTLGQQVDDVQAQFMEENKLSEAYAMECIAAELLNKAYEQMDTILHEKTGMWCGKYSFPGSDIPININADIIETMGTDEVVCNAAYVLSPKKSVVYITRMQAEKSEIKRAHALCVDCRKKDCPNRQEIGLIHLYYGDGKGKTTAAAGLALRAAGRGKKVIFAQFMKGNESGEVTAMQTIPEIEVRRNAKNYGFFNKMSLNDKEEITIEHNEMLRQIIKTIDKEQCDMLILDEFTYPYNFGLIDKALAEQIVKEKPEWLEIVMTGRNPADFFMEAADYITEMKCIRHPYEKGIPAREGIEY